MASTTISQQCTPANASNGGAIGDSHGSEHKHSVLPLSPNSLDAVHEIHYIIGLRFWLIIVSSVPIYFLTLRRAERLCRLAMSLFLTNLEIPIVTTSLVAITNDFGQFDDVGWVISSYLLGYVGEL